MVVCSRANGSEKASLAWGTPKYNEFVKRSTERDDRQSRDAECDREQWVITIPPLVLDFGRFSSFARWTEPNTFT